MTPEALLEANLTLVPYTVNRYFPTQRFNEDVYAAGNLGLWKACLIYKPELSAFSTIAIRYIHGYIQKELYSNKSVFAFNEIPENYHPHYIEQRFNDIETAHMFEIFFDELDPKEFELCQILAAEHTKAEAGRLLGVSHTTIDNRLLKIKAKYERFMKRRRNAKILINHTTHKHNTADSSNSNNSNNRLPTLLQP